MSTFRVLLAVTVLVFLCLVQAQAADLAKIDRTIAKEPVYKSKPKYCLLVFGPVANMRVWLVLDGAALYVDRNGNGDLTEAGEKIDFSRVVNPGDEVDAGDIPGSDGTPYCTSLRVGREDRNMNVSVVVDGKFRWFAGREKGGLEFADRPQEAPIVHFDGPLTLAADIVLQQAATQGRRWLQIGARLGTHGQGKGTFVSLHAVDAPRSMWPVAEVLFPASRRDDKPVTEEAFLMP